MTFELILRNHGSDVISTVVLYLLLLKIIVTVLCGCSVHASRQPFQGVYVMCNVRYDPDIRLADGAYSSIYYQVIDYTNSLVRSLTFSQVS